MNPAWKRVLDAVKKLHPGLSASAEAKIVAALERGESARDVVDDFISGKQRVVIDGVKRAAGRAAGRVAGAAGAAEAVGGVASKVGSVAGRAGAALGEGAAVAGRGALTGLRAALPWAKVLGKGALVGLGGAGVLYGLSQVPGMISDGLDMAEDAGLDPRGTRAPRRAMLQNQINMGLAEGMDDRGEMAQLEKSNELLAKMEGAHRGFNYGAIPDDIAEQSRVLRELPFLEAHAGELAAIQKKAQLQDVYEAAAQRLMRS